MFNLKFLLITATIMMSVMSDTPINQCFTAALGPSNQPASSKDCVGAPNTPVGNNCCFVSMNMAISDIPLNFNFCYAIPRNVDPNAVSSIITDLFASNGMTLKTFGCVSSYLQISAFLMVIIGILF